MLSLLTALSAPMWGSGCGHSAPGKARPIDVTDGGDDGDGDGGTTDAGPITILPDRPATYGTSGLVTVTGLVEGVENLAGLYADSEPIPVDADGRFATTLSLNDAPWRIVSLHGTDHTGREAAVTVQIGLAGAGEDPIIGGLESSLGPAGLAAVAAYLPPLLAAQQLGPDPDVTLVEEECKPCPTGTECALIDEAIVTTGAWSIETTVSLDPSAGDLDVVLDDTRILWEVEQLGYYTTPPTGRLIATLEPGTATPRGTSLDLDLGLSDDHAWSVEWDDEDPFCADVTAATTAAELLYLAEVPAEIEAATFAWGAWLDLALAHELDGAALSRETLADGSGIRLRYSGLLGETMPYLAPAVELPAPDTIDHALQDRLLGALLTTRLGGSFPHTRTWSDGGAGSDVVVSLDGVAADTVALSNAEGALVLLPPISYTMAVGGALCEEGHLIPAEDGLLPSTVDQRELFLLASDSVGVAGSDVGDGCGLGDGRLGYLEITLREALVGQDPLSWGPALGLADEGATLELRTGDSWSIRSTPLGP